MPDRRAGLSLGDFGISTSELVIVNQGDVKKDDDTGGRECGPDNPDVLADFDAASISPFRFTNRQIALGSVLSEVDSPVPPP